MKRLSLLFLFLALLYTGSTWSATVQVGSGTTATSRFPIYSCYNYNYSQQIYLASEIQDGGGGIGPITTLRFYYNAGGTTFANWQDWTIYLGNTTKSSFDSNTDWIPLTSLTEVFSGVIATPVAGAWLEIVLTTPFEYDGGNLVVAVDENSPGYSCTASWRSFASGSNRGILYYSDGTNPDPNQPPAANYGPNADLAQIQFEMEAYIPTLPPNCALLVSPDDEATGVAIEASLNWASGGGLPTGYYIYFGTDNPPTNIENGTDLGPQLSYIPALPLDYETEYFWQIVAYNDNGDAAGCDVWSFTTSEDVPPPPGCKYTVELYDSWGDGWNGNTLTVTVNGNNVLTAVTLATGGGPGIFEFYAETDDIIEFIFSGFNWPEENTYFVYNYAGDLVFEDGPDPTGGVIFGDCGDCQYSVELYDSYGDGWNGGALDVVVDGEVVLDGITLPTGFGPEVYYFTVFTDSDVQFVYTEGGWGDENSYIVYNTNGMEVFSDGLGGAVPMGGSIVGDCSVETGTLAGIVTDASTGDPLQGATISATGGILNFNATTNEFGEYEIELPVGEYDVIASAPGYEANGTPDALVTIIADEVVTINFSLVPLTGADCMNPILVDALPYLAIGQTNCGFGNNYNATCLGIYDGGEDIFYSFTLTEETGVDILLDPKGTAWVGMALFNECPPPAEGCIATGNNGGTGNPIGFEKITLEPGTYFIMIDTWPTPNCVPEFDLSISESPVGFLAGIVTDMDSGLPLEGVSVVAEPGAFQTFTDALGEYEMELFVDTYEITFSLADYFDVVVDDVEILEDDLTIVDAEMETIPAPTCGILNYPPNNATGIIPVGLTFEWEPFPVPTPVDGYFFSLYDFSIMDFIYLNEDLGNTTAFVVDLNWGTTYIWQLLPYNQYGQAFDCLPFQFTTASKGSVAGLITGLDTELPLEGVMIEVEQTAPNAGLSWNFVSDADGLWDFEWEAGTYDVSFMKYGYLDETVSGVQILPNQITSFSQALTPVTPYPLPFVEDWSAGSFGNQQWSVAPPAANWSVYSSAGNPAPSARFHHFPSITNYETVLQSYYIDGRNHTEIYAQFDLFLSNDAITTLEEMHFVVFDGVEWHTVAEFTNADGSIAWSNFTYDISEIAAGKQILIGFMAKGENSFNINHWYIDNIVVSNSIFDVAPGSVYELLFFDETSSQEFDLINSGFGVVEWQAEIDPAVTWATLLETEGTLLNGSQTIQVDFDATGLAAGIYEAEVLITENTGFFPRTVYLNLQVFDQPGQELPLPAPNQWGYISTYIDMNSKMTFEEAFAPIKDQMVILLSKTGIFWPAFNINTIPGNTYNNSEGYKIKMGDNGALAFTGDLIENQVITLGEGIHILPVLSEEPVDALALFANKPVVFAYSLDGSIYWPSGNIITLTTLEPGYGYLIKLSGEATFDFGAKSSAKPLANNPPVFENVTGWNEVYRTGDFHLVGVSQEATQELEAGDIIGVFNLDGLCTGMAMYSGEGQPLAVTTYADDMSSSQVDGMTHNEPLSVVIYRNGEAFEAEPVYSTAWPNYNGMFEVNGISMISSFKLGATSVEDNPMAGVKIYPNPSSGVLNIAGLSGEYQMVVTNVQGQVIHSNTIFDVYELDLTTQPNGLYFIRLANSEGVQLYKVIKN